MKLEHRISNELNRRSFLVSRHRPWPDCAWFANESRRRLRQADRATMDRRDESPAPAGQGQARDLPVHGRRPVAPRDVRQQTGVSQAARQADAGVVHQRPADRAASGKELKAFGPQHEFKRWGQSGQEFTHIFPHLGKIADEIAIIRSMQTEQINHDPAHTFMNTGSIIAGRPSMGSWINYGLGSENNDLPASSY